LFIDDKFFHDGVGPFEVEEDLVSLGIFEDDTHSFGFAAERKDIEDIVLDNFFRRKGEGEFCLCSRFEGDTKFLDYFDKCNLIGA
jgi:hypothetical protein